MEKNKKPSCNYRIFNLKRLWFLALSFLILHSVFSQTQICSDDLDTIIGSVDADPIAAFRPSSASCGNSSTAYTTRWTDQSNYIPNAADPIITLKVTLHIFRDNSGNGPWQPSDIPYIKSLMATVIQMPGSSITSVPNDNRERISAPRQANYSVSGFSGATSYVDSKIRYELTNIYFWNDNTSYTANWQVTNDAENYLKVNHPTEYLEGLPIIINNNTPTPHCVIQTLVGTTKRPCIYEGLLDTGFVRRGFRHEIGHALGLGHTYGGGELTPSSTDSNPYIHPCGSQNYLSDVFPANNPICSSNPPQGITFPGTTCGSCYEWTNNLSNNVMMADNATFDNRWISPLQMGRRIMHLSLQRIKFHYGMRDFVKDMSSNHANPWEITNDEVWDFDIQMYKDIVVKSGKKLTIQCRVAMPIDGKIIVEKGAQLVIDGGIVTTWCKSGLWAGIEVKGDPVGDQYWDPSTGYGSYQGVVRIIDGTISQAHTGITAVQGGIVLASGGNFINNKRDVFFSQYTPFPSASVFTKCQFKTTSAINDGQAPGEHVTIDRIRTIRFRGCNFEFTSTSTSFWGQRGTGIRCISGGFSTEQLCSGTTAPCNTPTTFKNLNRGVYVLACVASGAISINNSQFLDNWPDAIYLLSTNYAVVNKCYIRTTGVFPLGSGVYLNNCKYYWIKNNTLLQGTTYSPSKTDPGIYAFRSYEGAHFIYHNSFSGFMSAVNAVDNNSGPTNTADGLLINCNDFTPVRNIYDVALTGSGTGFYSPTVKYKQGITGGTATQLVRNKYMANCYSQNRWYIVSNSSKQVIHASNNISSSANVQPYPQPGCSNSLVQITNESHVLNYATHCPENPTATGGAATTPGGILTNVDSYINTLAASRGDDFELQAAVSAKIGIYLSDSLSSGQDTVIDILSRNIGFMHDADVQLVFAYIGKGDYDNATTAANALTSGREDWKALLLQLIAIYQEPDGIYSLNRTDDNGYKDFMEGYADTDGKDGQTIAQGLLEFACGISFTEPRPMPPDVEEEEEEGGGGRKMNQQPETASNSNAALDNLIEIYPNPTQTGVNIYYGIKGDDQALLEVKDLLGKIIYTSFISNLKKEYVSLSGYSNGIYFLTVTKNKEIVYKNKLIKQD